MGGLVGGVLGLVSAVGGGVLFVLIGKKAWHENASAKMYRIKAGAIVLGLLIALLAYYVLPSIFRIHRGGLLAISSFLVFVGFIYYLAGIEEDISG